MNNLVEVEQKNEIDDLLFALYSLSVKLNKEDNPVIRSSLAYEYNKYVRQAKTALEDYIRIERENNLPINIFYRKAYKDLKKIK